MPADTKPPEFKGLSNDLAIKVHGALIKRLSELILDELARDVDKINSFKPIEQIFLRAKWSKHADLILATSRDEKIQHANWSA